MPNQAKQQNITKSRKRNQPLHRQPPVDMSQIKMYYSQGTWQMIIFSLDETVDVFRIRKFFQNAKRPSKTDNDKRTVVNLYPDLHLKTDSLMGLVVASHEDVNADVGEILKQLLEVDTLPLVDSDVYDRAQKLHRARPTISLVKLIRAVTQNTALSNDNKQNDDNQNNNNQIVNTQNQANVAEPPNTAQPVLRSQETLFQPPRDDRPEQNVVMQNNTNNRTVDNVPSESNETQLDRTNANAKYNIYIDPQLGLVIDSKTGSIDELVSEVVSQYEALSTLFVFGDTRANNFLSMVYKGPMGLSMLDMFFIYFDKTMFDVIDLNQLKAQQLTMRANDSLFFQNTSSELKQNSFPQQKERNFEGDRGQKRQDQESTERLNTNKRSKSS